MSQQSLGTFEAEFDTFRQRHDATAPGTARAFTPRSSTVGLAFEHRTAGHRRAAAVNFVKAAVDGRRLPNLLRAAQALLIAPRGSG